MLRIIWSVFLQMKTKSYSAALFVLIMGLALAMVPVTAFPILRKHNEILALGYVVFRGGLETVTIYG